MNSTPLEHAPFVSAEIDLFSGVWLQLLERAPLVSAETDSFSGVWLQP